MYNQSCGFGYKGFRTVRYQHELLVGAFEEAQKRTGVFESRGDSMGIPATVELAELNMGTHY